MDERRALGLRRGAVELNASDPRWVALYEDEVRRLRIALGPLALGIEHVGSTSVPGLAAKPILDIAVGVPRIGDALQCEEPLESLGYEYAPWAGVEDDHVFGKGAERTHLVHVVAHGGRGWRDYLRFRDALRADAELRGEYEALKRGLAARYPDNRAAYTEAKGAFIRRVLAAEAR